MYRKLYLTLNCPVKLKAHMNSDSPSCCYVNKLARLFPDPTCVTSPSITIFCIICSSLYNKSNNECGIIRPTNAIYMGSHSLVGSKALSKCEVNPTSSFQDIVFTSNILHRVQC